MTHVIRPAGIGLGVVLVLGLSISSTLAGQTSSTTPRAEPSAAGRPDQIPAAFLATASEYEDTFRNLVSEETKTMEVFEASGKVSDRRVVVSDLIVYSSARSGSTVRTEYRDVQSVDGKPIEKRGERAMKLLTSAASAGSLEQELRRINNETRKYELRSGWRGFTINQGGWIKSSQGWLEFERLGEDAIDGQAVTVIGYQQVAPDPGGRFKAPLRAKGFERQSVWMRGRLWVDTKTHQLWRQEEEFTVRHPSVATPLVVMRQEYTYAPSQFGILVPQRFVFTWFTNVQRQKGGPVTLAMRERTTFTYGAFRRFGVTSDEEYKVPAAPR